VIPIVRHHLILKVALLVLVGVALGFGASTYLSTRTQVKSFEHFHQVSAQSLAESISASVRHTMLEGNGLSVKSLVGEVKSGLHNAKVRIYAPNGEEVFGEQPPPPDELPAHIRRAIETEKTETTSDALHTLPIANQDRCHSCHEGGTLRGVLTVGTQNAARSVADPTVLSQTLSNIAQEGFEQIMTSNHMLELDDYFEELVKETAGVAGVAVLDNEGDAMFGNEDIPIPPAVLKKALSPGDAFPHQSDSHHLQVIPLLNKPRCQGCHDASETMRGALVVSLEPAALQGKDSLLSATRTSMEHVMLRGLGRLIKRFLDEVAQTQTVTTLTLHDSEGRLYHDALTRAKPPTLVQEALNNARTMEESTIGENGRSEYTYVEPMRNERQCQSCHGTDRPIRGVVEVRLDTTRASESRAELIDTSVLLGGITVALVTLLLYLGLRIIVVHPVQRFGAVAERVGDGDFDAKVHLESFDEIGRLGQRMNTMISGLRQKLALSKFVSQETMRTVDAADGAVDLGGARRRLTVLFSDIRGFTAFSDAHDPEEVVAMLNRYLQVQADVVIRHGGDIDKYVGDELMARFDGPDMEVRATQCAVEILAAVARLNADSSERAIHVGVGVNVGDAVLGAMGSQERMDYTAIGDTVNLAARLCSAAKPGEVLLTEAVHAAAQSAPGVVFEANEPIRVKGKPDPIAIYTATGSDAS